MICCGSARQASRPPRVAGSVATVSTLVEHAGRLDWSHATGLIAFDTLGADGYYDIGIVRADGSQRRNLTARHPDLPSRHVGQPAWHPSGDYLVVQAEKQVHPRAGLKRAVEPGAGVYNDLWLLVLESGRAYPLRVVADEPGNGVLHAHFSRDGSQLAWSEMYAPGKIFGKRNLLGRWRLMVADFSFETDGPLLSNIRAYEPGGPGFYENHGFSPDGGSLLFSSNFEGKGRLDSHIYTMDLRTERLVRLTQGRGWNEHAHYSPDGEHIAWMLRNSDRREKGTDFWLMRADGSAKRRLTYFNRKGHPHHAGDAVVAADLAWSPDGSSIAAYHRTGAGIENKQSAKKVVLIRLDMAAIRAAERVLE
jgi:Tol biopolymer transport system component